MKFIFHNSSGFSPSIHVLHKRPQLLLERAPSFHSNDTHSTVLSEANTEESIPEEIADLVRDEEDEELVVSKWPDPAESGG